MLSSPSNSMGSYALLPALAESAENFLQQSSVFTLVSSQWCELTSSTKNVIGVPFQASITYQSNVTLAEMVQQKLHMWVQALPYGWPLPNGQTARGNTPDRSLHPDERLYLSEQNFYDLFNLNSTLSAESTLNVLVQFFCDYQNGYFRFFTPGKFIEINGVQEYHKSHDGLYQWIQNLLEIVLSCDDANGEVDVSFVSKMRWVSKNLAFAIDQILSSPEVRDPHWAEINDVDERVNVYPAVIDNFANQEFDFGNSSELVELQVRWLLLQAELNPKTFINREFEGLDSKKLQERLSVVQGVQVTFTVVSLFETLLHSNMLADYPSTEDWHRVQSAPIAEKNLAKLAMTGLNRSQGAGDFDALILYSWLGRDLFGSPNQEECELLQTALTQIGIDGFNLEYVASLYAKVPESQKPAVYTFSCRMAQSKYESIIRDNILSDVTAHASFVDPVNQSYAEANFWDWLGDKLSHAQPSVEINFVESEFSTADWAALFHSWINADLIPAFPEPLISNSQGIEFLNTCLADPQWFSKNKNSLLVQLQTLSVVDSEAARKIHNQIVRRDQMTSDELRILNRTLMSLVDERLSLRYYQKRLLVIAVDEVLHEQFVGDATPDFVLDIPSQILIEQCFAQLRSVYYSQNVVPESQLGNLAWLDLLQEVLFEPFDRQTPIAVSSHSRYNPHQQYSDDKPLRQLTLLYSLDHYQFLFSDTTYAEEESAALLLQDLSELFVLPLSEEVVQMRAKEWQNPLVLKRVLEEFDEHYWPQTQYCYRFATQQQIQDLESKAKLLRHYLVVALNQCQSNEVNYE